MTNFERRKLLAATMIASGLLAGCVSNPVVTGSISTTAVVSQDGTPEFKGEADLTFEFKTPVPRTEASCKSNTAQPIMDLLGFTEGTDKGDGYNETLAYGAFTGGDVDLTSMTLDQIDILQTRMIAHPDNTWNSSAIGRYQIVRTTLRDLKKKLDLSDDLKFTAELQDRLAFELLKGRGYLAWKKGRMSDNAFALGLAKEWASLPDPRTGKGRYSGQRAAVSLQHLMAVLNEARC